MTWEVAHDSRHQADSPSTLVRGCRRSPAAAVLLLLFNGVSPVEARIKLDFQLNLNNADPAGIWGNATTIWVANDGGGDNNKIYAYRRSDGSHDSGKDFNKLRGAGNRNPKGLWSDGTTMFVVDDEDEKVYAYKMSDRKRDSGKDFNLNINLTSSISHPYGIWGNNSTIWVINDGAGTNSHDWAQTRVYAYKRSDGSRDSGKDVYLNIFDQGAGADWVVRGLWSDGDTMWIVDVAYQTDPRLQTIRQFTRRRPGISD